MNTQIEFDTTTRDYEITTYCPKCHKPHTLRVNFADYMAWEMGELVQRAFPYLSAAEREMLISGICPDCWREMFC